MRQLLLVAAIAAAFAPTFARADTSSVQLVGRVQVEFSDIKINGLSGNRHQRAIADNGGMSRFGFRINEDLGGGLSAIAFIDWKINPGAGTSPFAREQWVGLQGKTWGNITFGRVNSPFKLYGHALYDPLVTTGLQLRGSGGAMWSPQNGFGATGFVDHAIRYETPKWGGLQVAVLLAPSNADQADPTLSAGAPGGVTPNTGGKGNGVDYQIAGRYEFGPIGEVVAGFSRDQANDAQRNLPAVNGKKADDERAWMLGGKLKFGDWGFFAQYDRIRDALASASGGGTAAATTGIGSIGLAGCGFGAALAGPDAGISTQQCNTELNTNGDGTIWSIGTNYKVGNTLLILQGGKTKADAVGTAPERRARNVTLGLIYAFSKRTIAYGGVQRVNVDTGTPVDGDRKTWTLGMRHNF